MDTRKMADVTSLFPHLRVSNSYIPTSPPKPPKATTSYSRSVQDAPYSALSGVVKDGRIPERQRVMPRCRERHQVGATNRWRLPESLYSDLLGNAQALKAINMPYNSSMIRIITGTEHPQPPPQKHPWSLTGAPPPPELPIPGQRGYVEVIKEACGAYLTMSGKGPGEEGTVAAPK
ncbi:hypothetical protein ACOMHN_008692 [Nucella lapillus]